MKRSLALLFFLMILLCFCGCMRGGLQATVTTATEIAPTREPKIQLEFFLEGMTEYQPATLYAGSGYSLYITDDGWLETPGASGEMTWTSSYNPDITLQVIPNAGSTLAQARDAIFGSYAIGEEDGQYLYGHSENGLFYRAARLIETPNGILAAVWNYSLEAAEGFGARLRVMADTLEIMN